MLYLQKEEKCPDKTNQYSVNQTTLDKVRKRKLVNNHTQHAESDTQNFESAHNISFIDFNLSIRALQIHVCRLSKNKNNF